jgi:hypothetical protein
MGNGWLRADAQQQIAVLVSNGRAVEGGPELGLPSRLPPRAPKKSQADANGQWTHVPAAIAAAQTHLYVQVHRPLPLLGAARQHQAPKPVQVSAVPLQNLQLAKCRKRGWGGVEDPEGGVGLASLMHGVRLGGGRRACPEK